MEKLTWGLLFLTLIVLDAIGDGLRDRTLKAIARTLKSVLLFILLGCMLFFQTLYWPVILWPEQCVLLILAYAFLRLALFDVVYNITIGYPYIFWISGMGVFSKIHAKFINWLLTKSWLGKWLMISRDFFLLFLRLFALVVGALLIKWAF